MDGWQGIGGMTPADLKSARKSLGLTQTQMADALGLGPNGRRTVRRWESGETPISGPAQVAISLMLKEMNR
jgi:DNA (cytosine-5)-methyltransferase 1